MTADIGAENIQDGAGMLFKGGLQRDPMKMHIFSAPESVQELRALDGKETDADIIDHIVRRTDQQESKRHGNDLKQHLNSGKEGEIFIDIENVFHSEKVQEHFQTVDQYQHAVVFELWDTEYRDEQQYRRKQCRNGINRKDFAGKLRDLLRLAADPAAFPDGIGTYSQLGKHDEITDDGAGETIFPVGFYLQNARNIRECDQRNKDR